MLPPASDPTAPDPGNAGGGKWPVKTDPRPAHALVYVGGGPAPQFDPDPDPGPGHVIVVAADGGCDLALAHGHHVDAVVGDLDSITDHALAVVRASGAVVQRHDPDKDLTDFELALHYASAQDVRHVTVVGGAGGRLDHLWCNVAVMASTRWAHLRLRARLGDAELHVLHGPGEIDLRGEVGAIVSLQAVHGPAVGVHCDGLAYRLDDAALAPDVGLGCSNSFVTVDATVSVREGTLVVIAPLAGQPGSSPRTTEEVA
jgi:thiamine pyrophosphokinase